jgi:hypothetical protein
MASTRAFASRRSNRLVDLSLRLDAQIYKRTKEDEEIEGLHAQALEDTATTGRAFQWTGFA